MGHGEIQTNHKDVIKLKMQIHPQMCPCLLVKDHKAETLHTSSFIVICY